MTRHPGYNKQLRKQLRGSGSLRPRPPIVFMTEHFAKLRAKNPSIDEFYADEKLLSPDLETL